MAPVTHIVLLKLKPEADATRLFEMLSDLKNTIPGLLSFSGGPNTSSEGLSRGHTHGFVMLFESAAARDAYLPHPAHIAVKDAIIAALQPDGVVVVDF